MAYLDFSEAVPTSGPGRTTSAIAADRAPLGPREWMVVDLARRDGLSSLAPDARGGRLRQMLFGTRVDSRLADPRLEALRRVAVYAWRQGLAVPPAEVAAFLAAGYGADQLEQVVTSVDARRGAR